MALKNLFLKGYSGVDEDDYCVAFYTQHDVYDGLFYVLDQASLTLIFMTEILITLIEEFKSDALFPFIKWLEQIIVFWQSTHWSLLEI